MALNAKQVAEIVRLYDSGKGEDVGALAAAYETDPASIRYQLKKAGVYKTKGDENAAGPTDEELGIGAGETDAPVDALAEVLKNPILAKLIDQAVAARLAHIQAPSAGPSTESTAVIKAIEHLLDVQSQQMPGYIKPLSAEELDRRTEALIEMRALIQDFQSRNEAPHYILGPQGLFDCTNVIRYEPGQEIKTFIEPVEDFVPLNEPARQIHAAFIRSIGGPTPEIGAQVAEAMLASKGHDVPTVGAPPTLSNANRVELVSGPKRHDVAPKRVAGTLVPESRGTSMPAQPGVTQQPSGPTFVAA